MGGHAAGEPVESGPVDEEAYGIVCALRALAVGEAGLAYLLPERRSICAKLWQQLENSDEAGRFGVGVQGSLAEVLPRGIEDLHPSWIAHALANEPEHIVTIVRSALPELLQPILGMRGSASAGTAPLPVQREIVRLAFAELVPLCGSDGDGLASSLCQLSFDELLAEVTRMGARTVGQSLSGSAPTVRARAMASVGEPWAQQILAAVREPPPKLVHDAAVTLVVAIRGEVPRTPIERLRQVGVLALRAELQTQHASALAKVAGRLPVELGRMLLGESCD